MERAKKRFTLSRQDIAALQIICARNPRFSHKLNTRHIDVKWILDKVPASVGREHQQHEQQQEEEDDELQESAIELDDGSVINMSSSVGDGEQQGEASSSKQEQEEEETRGEPQNGEDVQREKEQEQQQQQQQQQEPKREEANPSPTRSATGSEANAARETGSRAGSSRPGSRSSTRRRGRQATAASLISSNGSFASAVRHRTGDEDGYVSAPPPCPLLTIELMQWRRSQSPDEVVVNSPRSAFLILRSGLSVEQLQPVDEQAYLNKGFLDGVTVETVQMRVEAENDRRQDKLDALKRRYDEVTADVSIDDVVHAVREVTDGAEEQHQENIKKLQSIDHYAHAGKLDLTVLDAHNVEKILDSRGRTLQEVRQLLNQRDRVLQQTVAKERAIYEREIAATETAQHVQQQNRRKMQEKALEQEARREEVKMRVDKLLSDQRTLEDQKRQAYMEERRQKEHRVVQRRMIEKRASTAMAESADDRRRRIKKTQEEMAEARRAALVRKYETMEKVKVRERELRRERLEERSAAFNHLAGQRRDHIKHVSAETHERYHERLIEMMDQADLRTKEIQHVRSLRNRVKRDVARSRAEKGARIRDAAERLKQDRLDELEADYHDKLAQIERAKQEKREHVALQNEMSALSRNEKKEEQRRKVTASEFTYIGFTNANYAKTENVEREQVRRKVLTAQMRQEREAMIRARQQVIDEIDANEIRRRKVENNL